MAVSPDSAVHYFLKDNPSRRLLVSVKPTTPPVLPPVSILVLSLTPSVSPCRYCILSFSVPQLDPFLLLISLSAFLSPSHSVQGGTRQWQQYSRCTPAVQTGTAETAVPMLCAASPLHLEGRDGRELERSTKRITRPRSEHLSLRPSVSNLNRCAQGMGG